MKESVWSILFVLLLLVICMFTDLKKKEISMKIVIGFGLVGFVILFRDFMITTPYFPKGTLVGILVLLISHVSHGAVGDGDAYVLMVTGLVLSLQENLILLIGASVVAAVFGILLMVIKRVDRKKELPFIPFLSITYVGMILI